MALGLKPVEIVNNGKFPLLGSHPSWCRVFIDEIADVQNGFAFKSSLFTKDRGMPLIRIRDVGNQSTDEFYNGHYEQEHLVQKGEILIGMDGDFKCATWNGPDGLLNQRVCRIVFKKNNFFSRKFMVHLLQPYLNAINAETSSVTVKHLSSNTIKEIPLPLPPFREQQRIVAKIEELFSELDEGVESLKTAQQQLKVYRQAVLNSAIAGDTSITIEDIVERLDQGWSPKCHNEPSGDHQQWGVIKTTAIQAGYFQEMENKRLPENLKPRAQHELRKGDLLITRAGPRVRVGICCLVKKIRPHLLNCDKVYRIRVNYKVAIPEYIEILLNSPKYSREIEKMKTGISDSGVNLTQKGLLKIVISIPSIEEQNRIVAEIETRLSVADKLEETITQSLQQAEALRQSILKKAFEGKLVPQDPNDEPAEKLLERIRVEKAGQTPEKKTRKKKATT
jgi:type I restriction enzyme S subunit